MSVKKCMSQLQPNQRKAVQALASGSSVEEAATIAGVAVSTLYKWKRQDDFQAALKAVQGELASDYVSGLTGLLQGNLTVLEDVRDDPGQSAHVRLKAVQIIDDSLRKWKEVADFEDRLAALEAAVRGNDEE